MKRLKNILIVLVGIGFMMSGLNCTQPLIAALKDKDPVVRARAVYELADSDIKDPRNVEPLIAALKDKDFYVRRGAAEALKNIRGQDFGEDPVK